MNLLNIVNPPNMQLYHYIIINIIRFMLLYIVAFALVRYSVFYCCVRRFEVIVFVVKWFYDCAISIMSNGGRKIITILHKN